MNKSAKKRVIGIVLALSFIIPLFVYFVPGPIEGFWWNRALNCMCKCHRFWYFHDGKVIEYRSEHLPPVLVGTYQKTAWNTYSFSVFTSSTSPNPAFTLHGGLFFIRYGRSSDIPEASLLGILTSYLYRVFDSKQNKDLLKKAEGLEIIFLKEYESQQAGAGYPPQGVGSPDP